MNISPIDLLTHSPDQTDHNSGHKLLTNPGHLPLDTHHVVNDLLNIVPSSSWSDTLGPVKLATVHVGLNDGDDGLTLQLIVGVKQFLIQNTIHIDALCHSFIQTKLIKVIQFCHYVWNNFCLGKLAIIETVEESSGVGRNVCLGAVIILCSCILQSKGKC